MKKVKSSLKQTKAQRQKLLDYKKQYHAVINKNKAKVENLVMKDVKKLSKSIVSNKAAFRARVKKIAIAHLQDFTIPKFEVKRVLEKLNNLSLS